MIEWKGGRKEGVCPICGDLYYEPLGPDYLLHLRECRLVALKHIAVALDAIAEAVVLDIAPKASR